MKKLFLLPLFALIFGSTFAQSTFFRTYGEEGAQSGELTLTTDDEYIIVGSNAHDIYLLKIDTEGDTIWTKSYGGVHIDKGFTVQETYDSGFIIGGQTGAPDSLGGYPTDVFVLKTNATGDIDWTFRWQASYDSDKAYSVQQTTDSCYIVAGVISDGLAFILKLNSEGDSLWTNTFDYYSHAISVIETLDGGYVFTGQSDTESLIVKINIAGETVWTKKGNLGAHVKRGSSIIQIPDSSLIVTGTSYTNGFYNIFLSKTDRFGNLIWTQYFGGSTNTFSTSLDVVHEGGYILTGIVGSYTPEPFSTDTDIWLVRTDDNGEVLWTHSYETPSTERTRTVKSCPDGGFAITGSHWPGIFLLKVDSLGNGASPTAVDDLPQDEESLAIKIYPNPSTAEITVEFEVDNATGVQLTIYDATGNILRQFTESSLSGKNVVQISVADFPKGQYFLEIQTGGKTQLTKFLKI